MYLGKKFRADVTFAFLGVSIIRDLKETIFTNK